jgi:hypothetical protein
MKHLHGLYAFFGVPIEYFPDDSVACEIELAASLRHG